MSTIKKYFTSRFDGGYVVEADFSQLEVVGLAFLSQDEQLIQDILSGRDMHCVSASFLSGKPYEYIKERVDRGDKLWIKTRKDAKPPSFQLQYGAGYRSIAIECGLTEKKAKTFIQRYYERYPRVKEWQDENIETVRLNRKITGQHTAHGFPMGRSELISITNRRYVFFEDDAPEFLNKQEIYTSFSPTKIKNYPVQGFSTGDLVPLTIGHLYTTLQTSPLKDRALLINTIHDSIMLDSQPDVVYPISRMVKECMESVPKLLKETFDIDFNLPINVEVEVGHNWEDMKPINL